MKSILFTLIIIFIIPHQTVYSSELLILTENLPPLNYLENDKLVGPSVEIVKEIQKRIGSKSKIHVYPWARAYKMALTQANVVLFSMTYTKPRYNKFKWIGPLSYKRDILIAAKNSNLKIKTLEDAKKVKRIGTLREDTREKLLKSLGFTNLESVSDEQKNAKKLIMGRIDLWTYKKPGLKTVCNLAGIEYNQLKEVYSLRKLAVMIAFSLKTDDSIVQTWQKAFKSMQEDGTIRKIKETWNANPENEPIPLANKN